MTTAQLVFLYIAEELNISKAASRAHISQQCASNHIKNMEAQYGIALFNRKPSISLTPAGEALKKSLQQIYLIEKNMDANVEEISKGRAGKLAVGVNPTRGRILIPQIMERYAVDFPQVELSLILGDTIENLRLLEQGKIDIVLGIGAHASEASRFKIEPLSRDRVFFLSTERLIERYCPNFFQRLDSDNQVSLHTLSAFPFCRNLDGSTLSNLINRYLYQEQLSLDTRYNISDYDTQIELCARHLAASFCPSMILSRVFSYKRGANRKDGLLIFPIREITEELRVDLIQNTFAFQPYYAKKFIQEMKEEVTRIQNDVQNMIRSTGTFV